MSRLGDDGLTKPKEALLFMSNIAYKNVGGQLLLSCNCMFCSLPISSTGATRCVDHLTKGCALVPKEVKSALNFMRGSTDPSLHPQDVCLSYWVKSEPVVVMCPRVQSRHCQLTTSRCEWLYYHNTTQGSCVVLCITVYGTIIYYVFINIMYYSSLHRGSFIVLALLS